MVLIFGPPCLLGQPAYAADDDDLERAEEAASARASIGNVAEATTGDQADAGTECVESTSDEDAAVAFSLSRAEAQEGELPFLLELAAPDMEPLVYYGEELPIFSCEGDGMWYSSAGVTYPYSDADWLGRDYVGEECREIDPGGVTANRSTELDWMRFFWDLDHDQGVTTTKIFDIWDDANPNTWNEDGAGASSVCSTTDWPSGRLRCAADTEGILSQWDAEFTINGVHR